MITQRADCLISDLQSLMKRGKLRVKKEKGNEEVQRKNSNALSCPQGPEPSPFHVLTSAASTPQI